MNEEVAREMSTLVGDRNPLQVHAEAANTSRFGRLIARSRPIGTLVSSEGGTTLPGPGSVYLCRTLRFPAPVFLGDYENLMEAAQFMEMMDKRPGFKTACVQVIGWRNGWPTELSQAGWPNGYPRVATASTFESWRRGVIMHDHSAGEWCPVLATDGECSDG